MRRYTTLGQNLGLLQVVTDLLSLYVVAVTVCAAALAGFHSFSYMLDVADIFPGEKCIQLVLPFAVLLSRYVTYGFTRYECAIDVSLRYTDDC